MDNTYLSKITLLYIEDSLATRTVFAKRLERKVKKFILAVDGEDGYNKYLEYKPDIILTDIEMPKLTGFELSRKIKSINQDAIIIALSGHTTSSFFIEALESGIYGYFTKPVDKEKLHYQLEFYAKAIYLEKMTQQNLENINELEPIISYLINKETNISFITKSNKIIFENSLFLDFFNIKNIKEFNNKFEDIEDIFIKDPKYIYPDTEKDNNKKFLDKINKFEKLKKEVLILDSDSKPTAFYITVSIIDMTEKIYVINLIKSR